MGEFVKEHAFWNLGRWRLSIYYCRCCVWEIGFVSELEQFVFLLIGCNPACILNAGVLPRSAKG